MIQKAITMRFIDIHSDLWRFIVINQLDIWVSDKWLRWLRYTSPKNMALGGCPRLPPLKIWSFRGQIPLANCDRSPGNQEGIWKGATKDSADFCTIRSSWTCIRFALRHRSWIYLYGKTIQSRFVWSKWNVFCPNVSRNTPVQIWSVSAVNLDLDMS